MKRSDSLKTYLFFILLIFLTTPRITIYLVQGFGSYGTDAESRYFPQATVLLSSWTTFFSQTGPGYSAILALFQLVTDSIVVGPVIAQHLAGVITATLIFFIFARINIFLSFLLCLLVFCSQLSVALEHVVLRESLASLFLALTVFFSLNGRNELSRSVTTYIYFFLAGLSGLLLCLIRIEFVFVVGAIPLFVLIHWFVCSHDDNINRGIIITKSLLIYLIPFALILVIFFSNGKFRFSQYSGTKFNVAYHSLNSDVFYYDNSMYPDLLVSYQEILKKNGTVTKSMASFYKTTDEYLQKHPELKMSRFELMDNIFLEILTKNSLKYLHSYFMNFVNQALGKDEQMGLVQKWPTGSHAINGMVWIFTFPTFYINQGIVNMVVLVISAIAFPYFLINFKRFYKLPIEISLSIVIVITHLIVLGFVANPAARFRYPIDPFYYAVPIYASYLVIAKLSDSWKQIIVVK